MRTSSELLDLWLEWQLAADEITERYAINAKGSSPFGQYFERGEIDGQRYGQALFNCLYELAPPIADEIRGSFVDPFYNSNHAWSFFKRVDEIFERTIRIADNRQTQISKHTR